MEQCGCDVDVMWNIVEECGCFFEQCGCYVEHCGRMWMLCGTLWRNVDVLWRNVYVMWTLHISQFDQVLSPPWSVIFKYAIVDVIWTFHISTLTIKWTADPFCTLYSSVSVYWSCIWSHYCTRALASVYNVSLEALKSYAFAKSLGLVSQDLNSFCELCRLIL